MELIADERSRDVTPSVYLTLPMLKEKVSEFKATQDVQTLASFVYQAFSKPDNLCHSFLKDAKAPLQNIDAIRQIPLDLTHVREAYSILVAVSTNYERI